MVAYVDRKLQGLFTDTREVSFRGLETNLKKIPHKHSYYVGQNILRNFMRCLIFKIDKGQEVEKRSEKKLLLISSWA